MSETVNVKSEFIKNARMIVPPVLGMSVVLGFFNASEWTMAAILPKVGAALSMALIGCAFGLVALFIGLLTANARKSVMSGWFAGLMIGFAGIAFLLWFYANPTN